MFLTTVIAALALQGSAMDMLVDNALEISSSAGSYTTYFNADGTYTTSVGIEGTWEIVDDELCVARSTGETGCVPMLTEGVEVGSSWEGANAATGETVTYTIVARD